MLPAIVVLKSAVPAVASVSALGSGRKATGRALAFGLALAGLAAGCGRNSTPPREPPLEELEGSLAPPAIARALRRAGGGHYHARTTMDLSTQAGAGQLVHDAVTTTTDLWMDKFGHYRLLETNDRDGGREVVMHGRELGVALRYDRMVRRPFQDAEATRFLEEAVGGAAMAWEVARRFAEVARADEAAPTGNSTVYQVKRAAEPQAVQGDFEGGSPLQKWRDTVNVDSLSGEIRVDATTLAPVRSKLEAHFSLNRDGVPITGLVRVDAEVRSLGQIKPIEPPHGEELPARQRTILEERALLGRAGSAENAQR